MTPRRKSVWSMGRRSNCGKSTNASVSAPLVAMDSTGTVGALRLVSSAVAAAASRAVWYANTCLNSSRPTFVSSAQRNWVSGPCSDVSELPEA